MDNNNADQANINYQNVYTTPSLHYYKEVFTSGPKQIFLCGVHGRYHLELEKI